MRQFTIRLLGGSTLLALALAIPARAQDQKTLPAAPKGFDQKREGISRGKVETIEYDSKSTGGKRKMVVYTPPDYNSANKYPVFYLLHGGGDNETGWREKGSAGVILDNLYADKKIAPMIVVMPNGFPTKGGEKAAKGKGGTLFEDDLLKDIIPYVEAHYAVLVSSSERALAGLSMGAGQTLNIGLKHLDKFAWLGAFSGGGGGKAANLITDEAAVKKLRLFWISAGDKDQALKGAESLHNSLAEKKIPHVWHIDSGGHTWPVWKNDLYLISQMLFREAGDKVDVSGVWKADFDTQVGLQKYTFTLKQDGAAVSGKASVDTNGAKREATFKEGKIDGDKLTFVEVLSIQGNDVRVIFTGKASANEVKFTRQVGDFGSSEATAKRVSGEPAKPGQSAPGKGAAKGGKGFGGPIQLGPDDKQLFPDPPTGFNAVRDKAPHGDVKVVEYDSKTLGTRRALRVYTPPGYAADRKYPVLYLLHGLGNTSTEWTQRARAPQIVDNLLADGKIQPMIMIFPSGDATATVANPGGGGRAQAGYGEPFSKDLLSDIIPFVESHYSVFADRNHRALAGMSMGGGQTLNIGLAHVDTFAWIGAIASAPNTKRPAELVPDPEVTKTLKLLWLAVGNKDGLLRVNQGVHNYLKEKGVPHIWNVDGNGHDTAEMSNNLYHFAQRIFVEPTIERAPAPFPVAPKGFDKKRDAITRGNVETVEYDSKSVGVKRKMVIYTAPNVDAATKVPVLYLLHGAGDDETGWKVKGSADIVLDNLYADKKIEPMIVVMPNGFTTKGGKGKGGGGRGDGLENDILKDIIPYVESHYPVKTDRESRAIVGLSMGGGQALRIGLKNLDQFASVGGFSSAIFGKTELIKDGPDATNKLRLLWVSCGDRDSLMKGSEAFHVSLQKLSVPHIWHIDSGGHTWTVWKNDLYLISQMLFRDTK
jgi:enterochelin esterase-like enzyme